MMRRGVRFVAALVVGLALVTWAASVVVQRGITRWFERDLALRAQLAVHGSRAALLDELRTERRGAKLGALLSELAHDERIMAVELCSPDFAPLARTQDFPGELTCSALGTRLRAVEGEEDGLIRQAWTSVDRLTGGSVHVSAIPLVDGDQPQGFVVLIQDLSFAERRESETRRFLALAFGFLALSGSVIAIIAARLAWSGWSRELRRFLQGDEQRPEFQPIMKDVRVLVDRIVADTEADREAGVWSPDRLKHTLNRHLHGEKVVVVANREPYIHERPEGPAPGARLGEVLDYMSLIWAVGQALHGPRSVCSGPSGSRARSDWRCGSSGGFRIVCGRPRPAPAHSSEHPHGDSIMVQRLEHLSLDAEPASSLAR